jgi:hypothetical protein
VSWECAINARTLQGADQGSPLEVPWPILFNTWKHHAKALRWRVEEAARAGEAGLEELAGRMVVIGTKLMDLYIGRLWPAEVGARILAALAAEGRLTLPDYREWVEGGDGYRLLTFPEDDSRWVLGVGDVADRYVHLHPGRWSPATVRVRANVLKTAVVVLAWVGAHGGDPLDRELVNALRGRYLGLSPLGKDLAGELGVGRVIDLLRSGTG